MTITRRSSLLDVVRIVSSALADAGIRAVLTGGASASVHTDGAYLSHDLDFILQSVTTQAVLDATLASVGFRRSGQSYIHASSDFFVEFPAGPLAIGDDDLVEPVSLKVGRSKILTLSATDSCRDRLAAFYFWRDRQSLSVAVAIAKRRPVNLSRIQEWSEREDQAEGFAEFKRQLKARK